MKQEKNINIKILFLTFLFLPTQTIAEPKDKVFRNITVLRNISANTFNVSNNMSIGGNVNIAGQTTINKLKANQITADTITADNLVVPGGITFPSLSQGVVQSDSSGNLSASTTVALNAITKNGNTTYWPTGAATPGNYLVVDPTNPGQLVFSTPAGGGNVSTPVPFAAANNIVKTAALGSTSIVESGISIDGSNNISNINTVNATTGNMATINSTGIYMTGNIDMGTKNIINAGTITASILTGDISGYLKTDGTIEMDGMLQMGTNGITGVGNLSAQSATIYGTLNADAQLNLPLNGARSMSGNLNMGNNNIVTINDIDLKSITKNSNTVLWPSTLGASGTFLGITSTGQLGYAIPAGAGNVSAASNFSPANGIITAVGTNKTVQSSGVTIDSNNLGGTLNNINAGGTLTTANLAGTNVIGNLTMNNNNITSANSITATGLTLSNSLSAATANITTGNIATLAGQLGTTNVTSLLSMGGNNITGVGTLNATNIISANTITGNISGSASSFTGQLAGNVVGTQGATIVKTIGTTSATGPTSIESGANRANAATNANASGAIVKRDSNGDFSANNITVEGTLFGNVSGASLSGHLYGTADNATTAVDFSGSVGSNPSSDITGTQANLTVNKVGGKTPTQISDSVDLTNGATPTYATNNLVKRDGAGGFEAGIINATGIIAQNITGVNNIYSPNFRGTDFYGTTFHGNASSASSATTSNNFSNPLTGDVTGGANGSTNTVAFVGTKTAAYMASGAILANDATEFNTFDRIVKRSASGAFAAQTITLDGPINLDSQAATKAYVDSVAGSGISPKNPANVLSILNISTSGYPEIDGILTATGNRVLLTGQSSATQNGLWLINSDDTWSRPTDFPTGGQAQGAYCLILSGTTWAGTSWLCSTTAPNDIIDTDNLAFAQFSMASQTTGANVGAGTGQVYKDKTGQTLNFRTLSALNAYLSNNYLTIAPNGLDEVGFTLQATPANTPNTLIARDANRNFSANNMTGAASDNVLKTGDTMTGDLNITGAGLNLYNSNTGVKFYDNSNTKYVGLTAPSAITSSYSLALPISAPTANQILQAASPSTLQWASINASPANTRTIYVATYGSDSAPNDGSFTFPFKTLYKAVDYAMNTISPAISAATPVVISVGPGVYIETTLPIQITKGGLSIIGDSLASTIIVPGAAIDLITSSTADVEFSNLILRSTTNTNYGININATSYGRARFLNIGISGFATGIGISYSGASVSKPIALFNNIQTISNTTAIYITNFIAGIQSSVLQGAANTSFSPSGTGIYIDGTDSEVVTVGSVLRYFDTCINAKNGLNRVIACNTEGSYSNVKCCGGTNSRCYVTALNNISNYANTVNLSACDAGTLMFVEGSMLDCRLIGTTNIATGTAIFCQNGATININSSTIDSAGVGVLVDGPTTQTSIEANGVNLLRCPTDIVQKQSGYISFVGGNIENSVIDFNDPANVNLAAFNSNGESTLSFGNTTNTEHYVYNILNQTGSDAPHLHYVPNYYGYDGTIYHNPDTSATYNGTQADKNNAAYFVITGDKSKEAQIRLISDTNNIGNPDNVRGWTISKLGNSNADLAFTFTNNDAGLENIGPNTLLLLDAPDQKIKLPLTTTSAGTKPAELEWAGAGASGANLYMPSAGNLKTDSNFQVGGTLSASGTTLTGNLNMAGHNISNAGTISASGLNLADNISMSGGTISGASSINATNISASGINATGITMTGDIAMGGHNISNAGNITANGTVSGNALSANSANITSTLTAATAYANAIYASGVNINGTPGSYGITLNNQNITGVDTIKADTVTGTTGNFTNLGATTMTGELQMGGYNITGAGNISVNTLDMHGDIDMFNNNIKNATTVQLINIKDSLNNVIGWPVGSPNPGEFVGYIGTNQLGYTTPAGGGDVLANGTFGSANKIITSFNGSKTVQSSSVEIDSNANISGLNNISTTTITITSASATVERPSIVFSRGGGNAGIYSPAANELSIVRNGTDMLDITSAGVTVPSTATAFTSNVPATFNNNAATFNAGLTATGASTFNATTTFNNNAAQFNAGLTAAGPVNFTGNVNMNNQNISSVGTLTANTVNSTNLGSTTMTGILNMNNNLIASCDYLSTNRVDIRTSGSITTPNIRFINLGNTNTGIFSDNGLGNISIASKGNMCYYCQTAIGTSGANFFVAPSSFSAGLTATGASTFNATTTFNNNATQFNAGLTATGPSTFNATTTFNNNATQFNAGLTATGPSTFNATTTFNNNAAQFNAGLTATGPVNFTGNIDMNNQNITGANIVNAASFVGALSPSGDINMNNKNIYNANTITATEISTTTLNASGININGSAGLTATGPSTFNATTTFNNNAAQFNAGLTATGPVNFTGNIDMNNQNITGANIVNAASFVGPLTGHASLDLALTGGTMSGPINMGNQNITNANTITSTGVNTTTLNASGVNINGPAGLTATGPSTFNATTTFNNNAAQFNAGLTATGPSTFNAATTFNNNAAQFNSGLTATGPVNFTGGLTATGPSTFNATTTFNNNAAQFNAGLTATGPVNFTGGLTATGPSTFNATTTFNNNAAIFNRGLTATGPISFTGDVNANNNNITGVGQLRVNATGTFGGRISFSATGNETNPLILLGGGSTNTGIWSNNSSTVGLSCNGAPTFHTTNSLAFFSVPINGATFSNTTNLNGTTNINGTANFGNQINIGQGTSIYNPPINTNNQQVNVASNVNTIILYSSATYYDITLNIQGTSPAGRLIYITNGSGVNSFIRLIGGAAGTNIVDMNLTQRVDIYSAVAGLTPVYGITGIILMCIDSFSNKWRIISGWTRLI